MADFKNEKAIIVFARLPVKGKVKTRLAKELDIDFAASFYKVCAEHTFNEILKLEETGITPFLFCSEESELDEVKNWSSNKFRYYSQQGNDLGERMLKAFNVVFNNGYRNIILVGTDTPEISAGLMNDALILLESYRCVIGPSDDGGYYLIGFNSTLNYLFHGMEWSTNSVFSETIAKLKSENQSYFVLKKLIDIDTKEDLDNWKNANKSSISNPVKNFLKSYDYER